jgi:FkbM family methyltransferase
MDYDYLFTNKMEKVDFFQVGANVGYTETDMLFGQELVNKHIILIEPVPYIFKVLHENYLIKNSNNGNTNKIICFNFGISNKNDSLELYIPSEKNDFNMYPSFIHQLCSIHKDHIYKHISEIFPDLIIDKINVPCFTLNTIIEEMNIKQIDYLIIDTEGHDYDILMDLDLTKIKPNKIQFENRHMDGSFLKGEKYIKLINHLQLNGYKIIEETLEDTIMSL